MAVLGIRIEATEEGTTQRDFTNLPNGVYDLWMETLDPIEKDRGTPQHKITVKAAAEVVAPEEYKGRKIFVNYNVCHPNADAQRIGNDQFQRLLRAVDRQEFGDEEDLDVLRFVTFRATVGMGKDSKEKNADGSPVYPARNEIKRYWFPDQGNAPEIGITGPAPAKPANDNRPATRPAANQNAAGSGGGGARRLWGSKAA